MNEKGVLILDKIEYSKFHDKYIKLLLEKYGEATIYYTEYEDFIIRAVRKIPIIGKVLHHLLYWFKSFRYAINIYRDSKKSTIICINPLVAIFLAILNNNRYKLIMCGFLFEYKKNPLYYNLRKLIVKYALNRLDLAVVYAKQEEEYYNKIFEYNGKFKFVKYGIDYLVDNTYEKTLPHKYLFSGGGSNRDYKTLIEAYNTISEEINIPLCVATLPYCIQGLDTSKIKLLTDVVLENFGFVMKNSEIVILSLKETEISAGHQVMLQALSKGVPIIVNDIKAIRDYVSEDNVIFFESGNKDDLAQKIIYVLNNIDQIAKSSKRNIELYLQEYSFDRLLSRLIGLELS